jgi:hypothetical protein
MEEMEVTEEMNRNTDFFFFHSHSHSIAQIKSPGPTPNQEGDEFSTFMDNRGRRE